MKHGLASCQEEGKVCDWGEASCMLACLKNFVEASVTMQKESEISAGAVVATAGLGLFRYINFAVLCSKKDASLVTLPNMLEYLRV